MQQGTPNTRVLTYRAKQAEREGYEHPDEEQDDNGAKGHSCQGMVSDCDGVEDAGDAKAHQWKQVGCRQHCPNPVCALVP